MTVTTSLLDLLAGMGMAIGAGIVTIGILYTVARIHQKRRGIG